MAEKREKKLAFYCFPTHSLSHSLLLTINACVNFFFFTFNRFKSNKLLHCVWHKREAISVAIFSECWIIVGGRDEKKCLNIFFGATINGHCGCQFIDFYYCCCKNESIIVSCWGNWIVCKLLDVSILFMMNDFRLLLCWILYWNVKLFTFLLETFLSIRHRHTHTVSIFERATLFMGVKIAWLVR